MAGRAALGDPGGGRGEKYVGFVSPYLALCIVVDDDAYDYDDDKDDDSTTAMETATAT